MNKKRKLLNLTFNNKDIAIWQDSNMFCVALDTVLLANFVKLNKKIHKVIDFGTNNGILAILLAIENDISVVGIEIQSQAVMLAKANIVKNNLTDKITIIHDDIKNYANINGNDKNLKVDAIVCNPPFFPLLSKSKLKKDVLKAAARHELYIDMPSLIKSAAQLLIAKGKLFMIYPVDRMTEVITLLQKHNFVLKKMQVVYPKIAKNGKVFLFEAVYKTQSGGLIVMPPLICHNEDNSYIASIAKWYNNSKQKKRELKDD